MNLGRAFQIAGWMSDPELLFLAQTASTSKVIVEAGSFHGKSTRAMADNTEGMIHAVDPWANMFFPNGLGSATGIQVDGTTFLRFCLNLSEHIKSGRVYPHKKRFVDFDIPEDVDFIFIDALHDYDNCLADIKHAMKTQKKGIIAGHDYAPEWPGVVKAVTEVFGPNVKVVDSLWSVEL